jgi:hypothetical protein
MSDPPFVDQSMALESYSKTDTTREGGRFQCSWTDTRRLGGRFFIRWTDLVGLVEDLVREDVGAAVC